MLVVSRKENQSIVFPSLGISIDIKRVAGRTVKVGVQAPKEIRVLRGELEHNEPSAEHGSAQDQRREEMAPHRTGDSENAAASAAQHRQVSYQAAPGEQHESASASRHALLNRLNQATLALRLIAKQMAQGQLEQAEHTLSVALAAFQTLEQSAAQDAALVALIQNQHSLQTLLFDRSQEKIVKSKRALLVEDDPNERCLLASYLRSSGFEVDTACDGIEALEYLAKHKPDAVVMDMQMPRLAGDETVREIRSDYHFDDVKLFVVSGQEQSSANVPVGDRGIQRWFQKPLNPDSLVKEIMAGLN